MGQPQQQEQKDHLLGGVEDKVRQPKAQVQHQGGEYAKHKGQLSGIVGVDFQQFAGAPDQENAQQNNTDHPKLYPKFNHKIVGVGFVQIIHILENVAGFLAAEAGADEKRPGVGEHIINQAFPNIKVRHRGLFSLAVAPGGEDNAVPGENGGHDHCNGGQEDGEHLLPVPAAQYNEHKDPAGQSNHAAGAG